MGRLFPVHKTLTRHFRSVSNARQNVLLLQIGIRGEKFLNTRSRREEIEDQRHPNSVSPDARLAVTNRRIDADSFQ